MNVVLSDFYGLSNSVDSSQSYFNLLVQTFRDDIQSFSFTNLKKVVNISEY